MNRLEKKTTATLLIAIFMISMFAVAVSAASVKLDYRVGGSSSWVTNPAVSTEYSVLLDDGVTEAVDLGKIELTIDPILVSTLVTDPSYMVYEPTVVAGYHPYVNIYIDKNGVDVGDNIYGTDCIALEGTLGKTLALLDPAADTWTEMISPKYYGAGTSYTLQAPGTLSEILSEMQLNEEAEVYRIDIMYGMDNAANMAASDALYVDDITVSGKTYLLEPSGVTIQNEVLPLEMGFTISETSVTFPPVKPLVESIAQPFTITNTGDYDITLSAELTEDTDSFYATNLMLNGVPFNGWSSAEDIEAPGSLVMILSLTPPMGTVGTYTGTLVFWAEATVYTP